MPGCIGIDNGGADYCAFPEHLLNATTDQTQVPWQNGFQIKLYWEEGYLWQNETVERKCKFDSRVRSSSYGIGVIPA